MLAALAAVLLAAVSPADSVRLRDQRGREDGLASHRGHPTVALVVTARKLRSVKGWEVALRERCPAARFLRVADVPRDPPTTHDEVARKLAGRVPDEVAVLIDLEGAFAAALALPVAEVSAVVFDRDGRETARISGRKTDGRVAEVARALRALGACRGERP